MVNSLRRPTRGGGKGKVGTPYTVRDQSLIMGGGGGACEVLPLRKGEGAEKVLAMLKGGGGGTTSFGVVFPQ